MASAMRTSNDRAKPFADETIIYVSRETFSTIDNHKYDCYDYGVNYTKRRRND
jgi:hypothetical protein